MGKSDAPAAPDYKGQAIATANLGKYNEESPFGTVGWTIRPGADPNNPQPGDYIRTTTLSSDQQQLLDQTTDNQLAAGNVGGQLLGDLSQGTQGMQDALYRRATQYYDKNFGDQQTALRGQLLNSGLAEGSEAYKKAMGSFDQTRNTAYADAADRAIVGADQSQNSAVNRLAQIMAMSRGQAPTSSNVSGGPDLLDAANKQYSNQLNATNAENASTSGTVGSLAMAAAMYF